LNIFPGLISRDGQGVTLNIQRRGLANVLAAALLMAGLCPSTKEAFGQSCRPAVVSYIVRDEKGSVLNETDLGLMSREMTSGWGTRKIAFSEDGKSLISEYSEDAKRAVNQVPVLTVSNATKCELWLKEVTLRYGARTMRLVFNLHVYRRAIAIDSLPFADGTFQLELETEWPNKTEAYQGQSHIPAARWKKVSDKP
jgi:hypothetical protein